MRKKIVIILFFAILCWFGGAISYNFGYKEGIDFQKQQENLQTSSFKKLALWGLINEYKKKNNLPELKIDQRLCKLAKIRAKEITTDWSHNGFYNRHIFQYCPECEKMGENLSRGFSNEREVFNAWLMSKAHKENLDMNYKIGCLGIAKNKNNRIHIALELGK